MTSDIALLVGAITLALGFIFLAVTCFKMMQVTQDRVCNIVSQHFRAVEKRLEGIEGMLNKLIASRGGD